MVFIGKMNNYMFRPKAAIFRLSQLQFLSKSVIYMYISIDIYMTLFEQNIDIYLTLFQQNIDIDIYMTLRVK